MKAKILFVCVLCGTLCCFADQKSDVIVTSNAERIDAIITEVTPSEVKYHKFTNPTGPMFVMYLKDIVAIIYKNGEVQMFQEQNTTVSSTSEHLPKLRSIHVAGKYSDWQKVIDDMVLLKPFVLQNYNTLYIKPIIKTREDEIDEDEVSYTQYKKALKNLDEQFNAMYNKLGVQNFINVVELANADNIKQDENALVLNVTLLRLEPSNWADRVSRIRILAEVVDAQSGDVLATFRHQRLSSRDVKTTDVCQVIIQEIASDIANTLLKFVEHY